MPISSNIKYLRELNGLTQEQLANKLNVARSTVTQWETGWSTPRMGMIQKLAGAFGVDVSEIVSDKKKYHPLPPNAIPITEPKKAYVPLLGRVHAGDAQEPDILDEETAIPYSVYVHHKNGYLLEVEGNCMSKTYPEGCYVLIDPDLDPVNGSIAVVSIDGADYVMRRLYRGASTMILSPDSWEDTYEDIVILDSDEHTVTFSGVVVWFQASKELR